MEKIVCIKKPEEGYTCREVTVGKTYEVIRIDGNDYKLLDDNGLECFYNKDHFIPAK